ncbi:hypothetical protein NHQ30_003780 [Ciborinia camelliae]|nr:hypothetical protein NHQ30_003780 [Ciborinia camelliae]
MFKPFKIRLQLLLSTATAPQCLMAPPLEEVISNSISSTAVSVAPGALNETLATELLEFLAFVNPYASPESSAAELTLASNLSMAGIVNGIYTPPDGVDFKEAVEIINITNTEMMSYPSNLILYANNWIGTAADESGNFEGYYDMRAEVAWKAYLQLSTDVAIYPFLHAAGILPSWTDLEVSSTSSILFTFYGKPPVSCFWSLTVYGEDSYLMPNDFGIYALGDRSNLAYPDSNLVYSDNSERDDVFQILIQASNIVPPKNWTSNWLPGPSGGGQFQINLRYYGPQASINNLSYVQPFVSIIPAVMDSPESEEQIYTTEGSIKNQETLFSNEL